MSLSLCAQIIRTSWTKQSRGGKLASLRNAVPLALPLQPLQSGFLQIEHFFFNESHVFQNPQIKREQLELLSDLHYEYGSFIVDWNGQVATTEFKWDGGVPEPKVFIPRIANFVLDAGEWARIRWQGRFSDRDTGDWWYEHTCVNVGHFDREPHPNVFLCSKSNREFVHLPQLRW